MKKTLLSLSVVLMGWSLEAQSPRMSLFEEFTGENCGPCAATNPALNQLLKAPANASKIIAIKWQVPIPSAPTATWSLYKTNQAEIDWRYRGSASGGYGYPSQNNSSSAISSGVNSAPSGRIDGQHQWSFGATSDHPAYLTSNVITAAQSYTSAFSVTMTREWNKNSSAINVTVNIQATAPFTAVGALKFRTVMVEREINFASAPGSNGEKDFDDVVIKSFPTIQSGISMASTWTVGQSQTFTLNCPIPSYARNKEQIAMVGFIQDDGDRKVAQAARAEMVSLPVDAAAATSSKVDVTCGSMISPVVTIMNSGQVNSITDFTLTPYTDGIAGTPTAWNGNLAVGASVQVSLTPISTSTVGGAHSFSCDIDMNLATFNLSENKTRTNYMVVSGYDSSPIQEDFVNAFYPPSGWLMTNPDGGAAWSRSNISGGFNKSTQSSKYDFFTNPVIGDQDELYLPPLDLIGGDNLELSFDLAYAQRDETTYDVLDILISDDCGATWMAAYSKAGAELATTSPIFFPAWLPGAADSSNWRTEFVPLPNFNKSSILIKFVTTAGGGNNLYIDNVNLAQKDPVGIAKTKSTPVSVVVYPNPANTSATLKMTSIVETSAFVSLINTLGQTVSKKELTLNAGVNSIDLDVKDLPTGIYNIVIATDKGISVKKLTIVK